MIDKLKQSFIPITLIIFSTLGILICLTLGLWQLERLQKKTILIKNINHRLMKNPVNIKIILSDSKDLQKFWNWQPVKLTGTWNNKKHIILKSRVDKGNLGINIVTPFKMDLGPTVLINRGWFPNTYIERRSNLPKKLQNLIGILRIKEQRGNFCPKNIPKREEWYNLNVPEISKHLKLNLTLPFFISTSNKIIERKPIDTLIKPINNHLSYAITWFVLSVAITITFFLYVTKNFNNLLQINK